MEHWVDNNPKRQILLSLANFCENGITSYLKRCPIQKSQTQGIRGDLLSAVLPAAHREVTLKGCHDEVGHLGAGTHA